MSIVEDLRDKPSTVGADREIFVQHGSFSYLIKNYSCEPSAKEVSIDDENREWNISVYPDGREPASLRCTCRKLNVNTEDDAFFHLKLKSEDDEDVMCVRSKTSEQQSYIKVATGQKKCATADSAIKILSSVRHDDRRSLTSLNSVFRRTQFRSSERSGKLICSAIFLTSLCVFLMIPFQIEKCEHSNLRLKLNMRNSKTLHSDQMFMESVLQLYMVASHFNLTETQEKCAEFLRDYTEPNNLLQVIKVAHEMQGIEIKEFVKHLLPEDMSMLPKYPEWSEISSTFPELKAEIEEKTIAKPQEETNVGEKTEKNVPEQNDQKLNYLFDAFVF